MSNARLLLRMHRNFGPPSVQRSGFGLALAVITVQFDAHLNILHACAAISCLLIGPCQCSTHVPQSPLKKLADRKLLCCSIVSVCSSPDDSHAGQRWLNDATPSFNDPLQYALMRIAL